MVTSSRKLMLVKFCTCNGAFQCLFIVQQTMQRDEISCKPNFCRTQQPKIPSIIVFCRELFENSMTLMPHTRSECLVQQNILIDNHSDRCQFADVSSKQCTDMLHSMNHCYVGIFLLDDFASFLNITSTIKENAICENLVWIMFL